MKKLLLLLALASAFLVVSSASAAKPVPTLTLTPNPIAAYNVYTVTGCGYPRSATLTLELEDSSSAYYSLDFSVLTDASGCLGRLAVTPDRDVVWFQAGPAGSTDTITIWHNSRMLSQAVETVVFNG